MASLALPHFITSSTARLAQATSAPAAASAPATGQLQSTGTRVTVGGHGVGDKARATNNITQQYIPYRTDASMDGGRSVIVAVHPERGVAGTVDFRAPVDGAWRLVADVPASVLSLLAWS